MQTPEDDSASAFLSSLQTGQVCRGVVKSVTDFGVFVDLGDAVGIVTVPNLSWKRIDHPSQAANVGQEVIVTVLSVDLDHRQASLSLKELQQDPFLNFARTRFGSTVMGIVTKMTPVGVFTQLEDGILGFFPNSEFTSGRITAQVGDTLTGTITYINVERRQVFLSPSAAVENT
ncbi:S1 RNA-binding domain-containing protein [Streptomyces sp. NPDC005962]|uniref:S1 RNA-binding domain-containing protein n=1 Tax=Streptomyces sp. NPDC005962 TaxID=3154466 RepID=UPI0033CE5A94